MNAEPGLTDGLFNKYSLGSGPPDFTGGPNNLRQLVLESVFQELPPELITGILGYLTVDDKLALLRD